MSKFTSTKFELFATTATGGAISMSGGSSKEAARECFRRLRADPQVVRIRVREDTYYLGGGRDENWIADWSR